MKEWIDAHDPGAMIIPFSASFELALLEMGSDEEREAYCKEKGTQR